MPARGELSGDVMSRTFVDLNRGPRQEVVASKIIDQTTISVADVVFDYIGGIEEPHDCGECKYARHFIDDTMVADDPEGYRSVVEQVKKIESCVGQQATLFGEIACKAFDK